MLQLLAEFLQFCLCCFMDYTIRSSTLNRNGKRAPPSELMTEGEKQCGLGQLLPMSCRGRAEAFARRLHSRLRTLGSQDTDDPTASESSWLTSSEMANSVTSLQPRHSVDGDLFMDFGMLDSPGSPEEEIPELEFTKLITNVKDDLNPAHDKLNGIKQVKRNSPDSDDTSLNGVVHEETPNFLTSSTSTTELSSSFSGDSRSRTISEGDSLASCSKIESPVSEDSETTRRTCGWDLTFEPDKLGQNNNEFHAIDLETLRNQPEDCYCSQLTVTNDLVVECPEPVVQVSTLEIHDIDDATESSELSVDEPCRIPRVRRCSSLKTGKTPPGTPGRKKIVRFADVLGLDLADVRTFMDEIPKIPTSAFDDLSDADLSLSLSDNSISSSAPSNNNPRQTKTLVPLFQQPGGEADFLDRITEHQVCLENALLQDPVSLSVSGIVRVRNLDFHKSVHIRYSLDSWKTFSDMQATYVSNSCDGFSDKFSFTLFVHTLNVGERLEFAARFHCKGCQYWDNNFGTNYCFQCMPTCNATPYVPVTSIDRDHDWPGASFY